MTQMVSKLYEIPSHRARATMFWLKEKDLLFFSRFGLQTTLIQLCAENSVHSEFSDLQKELWVQKAHTVFPKKHRKLVESQLEICEIDYRICKNPFSFEIVTEIDQRVLARFRERISKMTKRRKKDKGLKMLLRKEIPNDASSLFEDEQKS